MHATDPSLAYFDEILASPTPDDMYLDSFHGDDTMHGAVGSLPVLSLDEEKEANEDSERTRGKSPKRSKSKKKSKSKRLSSESEPSKKSTGTTKSKRKSSRSSKSKKNKTPEDNKNVDSLLKKLEEYEESLQEEWQLLQKERASIAVERETLQLKMCEVESKLGEVVYDGRFTASSKSHNTTHNDELRIENAILQRRLQRKNEIILQLSNSNENTELSKEVLLLEKELRRANEVIAKIHEKIIKGQNLTIERMQKETSGNGVGGGSATKDHMTTDNDTFPIQVVGQKVDDDNDDGTASIGSFSTFAESTLEDSFSSLRMTTKPEKRKTSGNKNLSPKSLGQIKCWVKARSNVQRELFRNSRTITPEEAALSSLVYSI